MESASQNLHDNYTRDASGHLQGSPMLPTEARQASAAPSRLALIRNVLGFQLCWWGCVLGGARGWPWLGPICVALWLVFELAGSEARLRRLAFCLGVGLLGSLLDGLLVQADLLRFEGSTLPWTAAPIWIAALWVGFANTLGRSMSFLRQRPLVGFVLGALAGPLAYYGGQGLGAVAVPRPLAGFLTIALAWAIALPVLVAVEQKWVAHRPAHEPASSS